VIVPLFGKCGSSHLHKVLATHPAINAHRKEVCSFSEPRAGDNRTDLWTMCLHGAPAEAYAREVPPGPSTKVIMLLRDPADFFWAAYNFWSSPADAKIEWRAGAWTNEETYRSPEHAHETLRAGGKLFNYHFINYWRRAADRIGDFRDVFGAQNLLALRTEDLGDETTWRRVADFLGLPPDGFDGSLIASKTNSGASFASRGMNAVGDAASGAAESGSMGGLYEVSGRRPMLCETRDLVYNLTRDACERLDREFGLRWEACLDGGVSACQGGIATVLAADSGEPAAAESGQEGVARGVGIEAAALAGILLFALGCGAGCASSSRWARQRGAQAATLASFPKSCDDGEKAAIMRGGKGGDDGPAAVACGEPQP